MSRRRSLLLGVGAVVTALSGCANASDRAAERHAWLASQAAIERVDGVFVHRSLEGLLTAEYAGEARLRPDATVDDVRTVLLGWQDLPGVNGRLHLTGRIALALFRTYQPDQALVEWARFTADPRIGSAEVQAASTRGSPVPGRSTLRIEAGDALAVLDDQLVATGPLQNHYTLRIESPGFGLEVRGGESLIRATRPALEAVLGVPGASLSGLLDPDSGWIRVRTDDPAAVREAWQAAYPPPEVVLRTEDVT